MNTIVLAACSCIIYAIIHYIDRKVIKKQDIDNRNLFRTTAIMFVSIMAGSFVYDQFELENISNGVSSAVDGSLSGGTPKVFTDNPGF